MPDTFTFYVAGYIAAGVLYAGYVVSLVTRARKARRQDIVNGKAP